MIAVEIQQKDARFYFVGYPAMDLLRHVRFISRFHDEGGSVRYVPPPKEDEVARFIAAIERSDEAFQRELAARKIRAIRNFYENAVTQPPIPGTVLLFTEEQLEFRPVAGLPGVGHLQNPIQPYLIIDGQHRLAALHFFAESHPQEAETIQVPCMIFDGRSKDFAAEMFVIINSTPTRINKSHLVDLYEKVTWVTPQRRLAARIVDMLYRSSDSPLRYRINRLGGHSSKDKWILQAELFHEIHRWVGDEVFDSLAAEAKRRYQILSDFLFAARHAWSEAWGNEKYMVTRPVTIRAMIRVCVELTARGGHEPAEDRLHRWMDLLQPWSQLIPDFRVDDFYRRFPAKGQTERIRVVQNELWRRIQPKACSTPTAAKD